jgi:hypothetical protein
LSASFETEIRAVYSVRTAPGWRGGVVDAEDWDGMDVDGEGEGVLGFGVVKGGSMSQVPVSPGMKVVSGVVLVVGFEGKTPGATPGVRIRCEDMLKLKDDDVLAEDELENVAPDEDDEL